jgi:hypothetical protein
MLHVDNIISTVIKMIYLLTVGLALIAWIKQKGEIKISNSIASRFGAFVIIFKFHQYPFNVIKQ